MAPGAPPNPTKQPPPPLPRQEKRIALTRDFVGFHGSIEIGIKLSLSCGASNLSRQARKIGCSTRPNRSPTRGGRARGKEVVVGVMSTFSVYRILARNEWLKPGACTSDL